MACKIPFIVFATLLMTVSVQAQECTVDKEELKGTYTGDCKKGKANGKGKAVGTDTYEGDFKSGLPEGTGVYQWKNGSEYTGQFSKGWKQGKGKLVIKRTGGTDSVLTGYWKKDLYVGEYENPYRIIAKSKSVADIEVEYKDDPYNKVTFFITSASGGAQLVDGSSMAKMKIDEVRAMTGAYGRLFVNDNPGKKSESVIEDIRFPFRMKAIIGTEEIEMEFFKPGTYVINARINE